MFNKEEYWDNRKKGWRGQGPHPYQILREYRAQLFKKVTPKKKKAKS